MAGFIFFLFLKIFFCYFDLVIRANSILLLLGWQHSLNVLNLWRSSIFPQGLQNTPLLMRGSVVQRSNLVKKIRLTCSEHWIIIQSAQVLFWYLLNSHYKMYSMTYLSSQRGANKRSLLLGITCTLKGDCFQKCWFNCGAWWDSLALASYYLAYFTWKTWYTL